MFYGAYSFNQDLSPWDGISVVDISGMFQGAKVFNKDMCSWENASHNLQHAPLLATTTTARSPRNVVSFFWF
jgi:hypothetical protein